MSFVFAAFIFVVLAAGMAAAGMRLYVRPKEAMDRVVGIGDSEEHIVSHPSLAIHALVERLGNFIPQSPKDVTVMQRRLIRAGIRNENALKLLYGAKAFLGVTLPVVVAVFVMPSSTDPSNKFAFILGAAAVGFF